MPRNAHLLGHDPTRRIICASYAQDLATKFHDEFRRVIESDWFHALFPEAALAPLKDTGQELILPKNGSRLATSVGGTLTGRGADILIIDDPLKAQDAYSDVRRGGVNDWLRATAMSRLDDKRNGAVIIIMQRLHVDDPVGHLLERSPDDWDVLDLPAIAPADIEIATGWKTSYLFAEGALLHPAREPAEVLDRLRRDLGSEAFESQYLQRPVPPGGNLIKREWLRQYDALPTPMPETTDVIQSWDTASKTGLENDWSVCTTWMYHDGRFYLLDLVRAKLDYPGLRAEALRLAQKYRPWRILIEDTGVGTGLIADLCSRGQDAIAITPRGNKADRLRIQSAKFEAGRVLLPARASWLSNLMAELLAFPSGRHDDQVDSVSQALADEATIEPVQIEIYSIRKGWKRISVIADRHSI